MVLFLSSTKLPMRAPAFKWLFGRSRAKGPIITPSSRRLSATTQCGSTVTPSPRIASVSTLPGRMVHCAPMFVVGFHLRQRGPEFLQREAINRRIDFVDFALLVGELRLLDDGRDSRFGLANDAAVAGGIGKHRRENCRRCVLAVMRGDQSLQSLRANEGGVARQHNRKLRSAQGAFGDLLWQSGAVMLLAQYS